MNKLKNNKKIIITISIILILFIILTYIIFIKKETYLDDLASNYILDIRNDKLTDNMIRITNLGGAYALIAISLILLIVIKNKKYPLTIIINLISVFTISQIMKLLFSRTRPAQIHLVSVVDKSFPSGHTMVSLAYYSFLAYLIFKHSKKKYNSIIISLCLLILPLIIAFSRIYLGVHYLTDIIGGILLGTIYIIIYIYLYNKKIIGGKKWKL